MKRQLLFGVLVLGAVAWTAPAQNNPAVLAEAQRQEAEERYRRMFAKVEDLESAIQAYQQRLNALEEENHRLHQEIAGLKESAKGAATTQENLKRLTDAIQKVDESRMADNQRVVASFEELKKLVLERSAPSAKPKAAEPGGSSSRKADANEKGYKYTIRSGDNLSRIVTQLNKQGVKVTQKQVMEANPGVKWERLRIGDELFIPAPGGP